MYKALFFAGRESGLTKDEVLSYRTKYGQEFKLLGFDVKDPSLGKDIEKISPAELLKQDDELQDQSHITVAYLPELARTSEATLREIKRAKDKKQLVYGFTDKGNGLPQEFVPYIDAWFTDFSELKEVLTIFIEPIGRYFTLAHTNNIEGDVFIYGADISEVAPHHLHSLLKKSNARKNIFYFCCETSHINDFAQKLPTILRLGKVGNIYILTKDGTPHDIQMHTLTDEVVENQAFRGNIFHFVVEKGKLIEANLQAVKASRHLCQIMNLINQNLAPEVKQNKNVLVSVLVGAKSDENAIEESGLFNLLGQFGLPYEYKIISSDRNPEELRRYCFDNKDRIKIVIAIAGGVPNLPIVVKGWLPDTPVISVPLDNNKDYAFASLTTPRDRPIIVTGFAAQGLKKAAFIAKEILRPESE